MKFYELDYDDDNYEPDGTEVGDSMIHIGACPKYGLKHPFIWKKREGEKGNLIIDLPSLNIGDFLQIWGGAWMITERTAQLFKEAGFTGYELRPVRINEVKRMKKGESIPKLWQLVVTGWGGTATPESGWAPLTSECEFCKYRKYSAIKNFSALIDPSQWDGSDFFMVWPIVRYIFVAEKVKEFIENNRLSGCKFREPKDIPPIQQKEMGSRPSLYLDMSQPRAKEIGEPLGLYWEPPKKGTEEYTAMREALLKIYKETYTSGEKIVYLPDEDGYIVEPRFDEGIPVDL
jgi:hypothetical protein